MDSEPLWVGLIVTIMSAIAGYWMVANFRHNGMGSLALDPDDQLDDKQLSAVRMRLQRDLDVVQVAASAVAFCGAAIVHDGGESSVSPLILIAISAAVPLGGTVILLTRSPSGYDKWTNGVFTPLTSVMTALYGGALTYLALR